jgi:aspartate/methionine/tyrosine aminotransferase
MKYLGNSPENLFQRIKRYVKEYEEKHGKGSSINIAVGEPDTCPPETVRKIVAEQVLDANHDIHTYWDNRDPGKFCRNLIKQMTNVDIDEYENISSLVLPGEKSMIGLLPIACGANRNDVSVENEGFVKTSPAYDLVGQWAEYLGEQATAWPLYSSENFQLNVENLPKTGKKPRMIITVKPGNPCPAGATRKDWEDLIAYCIEHNIRLVNDGAYTSLTHKNHTPLCQVAKNYPELDWIEYFSISKAISACGWRLGAAIGSNDFIDELTKIKGNADSGPFGPALVGCEQYFGMPESKTEMQEIQKMYERRLDIALKIFDEAGFTLACPTDAGFFMLFHCPKTINGEAVKNSEEFNQKMISELGLVGVPFTGAEINGKPEQFIRYSVCSDFENPEIQEKVKTALAKVKVGY